jgi:hypothetical protein
MTAEPGNSELQRAIESLAGVQREGFANVRADIAKLVSQEVFLAEQRRVEERLAAQQADIAEEKAERIAAIKDEQAAREKALAAEKTARETAIAEEKREREKVGTWVRWVAASIAIPTALFVANLVQGKPGS